MEKSFLTGGGFWACLLILVMISGSGCAHSDELAGASDAERKAPEESDDKLTRQEIDNRQAINIEELLQSRIPGMDVRPTIDGGYRIRIRGSRSISGNNEPLFIVDGVPTEPMNGSGLLGINPYDVQSIEVLKGSEAAIYGMRGANGVIVIETRDP